MSGFKLLGIRIFSDCSERFSKNLKKGEIYKFYDDYEYLDKTNNIVEQGNLYIKDNSRGLVDNDVYEIIKNSQLADDFYDVDRLNDEPLKINVSALVGKNGSGKSSLIEIIYVFCYIISLKKGIIQDHSALSKLINNPNVNHNRLFKKIQDIQGVYTDLRAEIYYEIDSDFFSIWCNAEQEIYHRSLSKGFQHTNFNSDKIYVPEDDIDRKFKHVLDSLFFYTISINYSLYGLNAGFYNSWLNDLFHKNDGYQTPLVINPFREDGNIDANSELHLAQSRLLSNLIDDSFLVKEVVNQKKVDSILFTLDYSKFNTFNVLDLDNTITDIKKNLNLDDSDFITNVYNAVYTTKQSRIQKINLENVHNSDLLVKYVYRKILKIYSAYDEYRAGIDRVQSKYPLPNFNQIFKRLIELRGDRSHITLKLRQVLNAIRFNTLGEKNQNVWKEEDDDHQKDPNKIKKRYFRLKLKDFISRIKDIKISHNEIEIIELIPNACFRPSVYISSTDENKTPTNFYDLSSGEQHFIHSVQSVLYHIANVNSVFYTQNKKIRYNYINLIFDEIELYYHPEFQRSFLSELLNGITNLHIPYIKGLNILFSSHSTFILSDITRNSVLKLIDGQIDKRAIRTFGANIHDLLADSFFLEDGFMGKFAQDIITDLINYLTFDATLKTSIENVQPIRKWNKESAKKLIDIIDEPLIKERVQSLYNKKILYNDKELLRLKIQQLNNQLNKLEDEEN